MSDIESSAAVKPRRQPSQRRSAARMAIVIEVAERLLEEVGPEKTSIPLVAQVSGVPRAAIYPFFVDKYALFSHIARLHMERLVTVLTDASPSTEHHGSWRAWLSTWIEVASDYYNQHPVASILLLRGGEFADDDVHAHRTKNETLSRLLRSRMTGLTAVPTTPDVVLLAVEIAFACMKYGFACEGTISRAIRHEATQAAQSYLARWEPADAVTSG